MAGVEGLHGLASGAGGWTLSSCTRHAGLLTYCFGWHSRAGSANAPFPLSPTVSTQLSEDGFRESQATWRSRGRRAGGVFLPDTAKEKPQEGRVLAVGTGRTLDNGTKLPMDVKPGDKIIYSKYSGSEIKIDGKEYLIISEKDVLAVVTDAAVPAGV
jgi:chaperonin GroES